MNAHTPFDANKDWTNPYCQNSSNDPMVDALLGNAYHVVRTVYCNLGNLKLIYDFLNQYGMVSAVESEAELKAAPITTKFMRIYDKSPSGDRQVTDYLYVEGDRTGIIPDDTAATGSWIKVATSSQEDGNNGNASTYVVWGYTATGGENTITVPTDTVGVAFITVDGFTQTNGKGYSFNAESGVVTLAQSLEAGEEVLMFLTGMPAVPDTLSIDNWRVVNWLYNQGAAVGGEQVINIPFVFADVSAVYVNGSRLYKNLSNKSYEIDVPNRRIFLTEPLTVNDRVILTIGGTEETIQVSDRTLQEVARGFNLKDSEVILDSDHTTFLNNKKVVYVSNQQKSYKLPTLPPNVSIAGIVGDQLTYVPGNITVTLLPITII